MKNCDVNVGMIVLACLLEGLQALVLAALIMASVPVDISGLLQQVLDKHRSAAARADWEVPLYRFWVLMTLVLGAIAVKKSVLVGTTRFRNYLCYASLLLFLQVLAGLKVLSDPSCTWAWHVLLTALVLAVGLRLLWREIEQFKPSGIKIFIVILIFVLGWDIYDSGGIKTLAQIGLGSLMALMAGLGAWGLRHTVKNIRLPAFMDPMVDTLAWISAQPLLRKMADWAAPVLIVALIWAVDAPAVIAKMAFGEHFYHYDICLMAGAWASSVGNRLGVDQIVMYGLGMPTMIGSLAKTIFGLADYLNTFVVYMALCCAYFVFFYVCMRQWLNSALLGLAAVLLAIKWQMFYSMSYPVTWIYPGGSVLRFLWDLSVMACLWGHIKTRNVLFLAAGGAISGMATAYVLTTGIDLVLAYGAYIIMHLLAPQSRSLFWTSPRDSWKLIGWFILPVVAGFGAFWLACGNAIFSIQFWRDLCEYPYYTVMGIYKETFWANWAHGQYWYFIMGCVIPLSYLFSLLWAGIRFYLNKARDEELIVLAVSVYGLSVFHHFVALGVMDGYYQRAIPFVVIVFYWISLGLQQITDLKYRAAAAWGVFIFCALALLTNYQYAAHPNVFNASRNPMVDKRTAYPLPDGRAYFFHKDLWWLKDEQKLTLNSLGTKQERIFWEWDVPNHVMLKDMYRQEFDFSIDAALIRSLTKEKEKVALISSFEIEMLIQARRRPFFFQFPLIESRALTMRTFPQTVMLSKPSMQRTLNDLKQYKPPYIFMEKIFLNRDVPAHYHVDLQELMAVLDFVNTQYEPHQAGQYLVAMKRKG